MYGAGILRTLGMTLYHFLMTYVSDARLAMRRFPARKSLRQIFRKGEPPEGTGIFTVEYPQEQLPLPERARNLPFLVIDAETERLRCTACGVCAQICPVQCIWIERARDPETGRPRRYPVSYYIDISLCMNCGFCAQFCPFDAIKMDHVFEIASAARPGLVSAKELAKPEAYHARLHPSDYAEEQAAHHDEAEEPGERSGSSGMDPRA